MATTRPPTVAWCPRAPKCRRDVPGKWCTACNTAAPPSFRDILDVPEEIAAELDRVYPKDPRHQKDLKPAHRPPLGQDMVMLPKHYARFEIEPIRFIAANKLDFLAANIIKYTCRAEFKHTDNGLEDSLKVIRYAVMRAKFLQGDHDWWKAYRNTTLHALIQEEITGYAAQG